MNGSLHNQVFSAIRFANRLPTCFVFVIVQDEGLPGILSAKWAQVQERMIQGAPQKWQEQWFRERPRGALEPAKYKKTKEHGKKNITRGGVLSAIVSLLSNKGEVSEEYYRKIIEVGQMYEAGTLVECKAKGLDIVGRTDLVKRKKGRPMKTEWVADNFRQMLADLYLADQMEILDKLSSHQLSFEKAKEVSSKWRAVDVYNSSLHELFLRA